MFLERDVSATDTGFMTHGGDAAMVIWLNEKAFEVRQSGAGERC